MLTDQAVGSNTSATAKLKIMSISEPLLCEEVEGVDVQVYH